MEYYKMIDDSGLAYDLINNYCSLLILFLSKVTQKNIITD